MKKALITGITGQDGSYLAEFLLLKGYEVHGIVRPTSSFTTSRIDHIFDQVKLHYADLTDMNSIQSLVNLVRPDEIYNLAAQSHVGRSFTIPGVTTTVDALGVLHVLEAVRHSGLSGQCRIYQASSSEMFGNSPQVPQKEDTPFYPQSPYACAKVFSHHLVANYRNAYGMFICSGILFNHESPRRDYRFVTRKVTKGVADYVKRREGFRPLHLGDLNAQRDWGYAGDYVRGMWAMLQQDSPEDFVLATGTTRSVRALVEIAFGMRGIDICWQGKGPREVGMNKANGDVLVVVDPAKMRPSEVYLLQGDASKARKKLGWEPRVSFKEMIESMIAVDE